LFIVPVVYTYLRKSPPVDHDKLIEEEERERVPGPEPWRRLSR
jgi:hypothetical protein